MKTADLPGKKEKIDIGETMARHVGPGGKHCLGRPMDLPKKTAFGMGGERQAVDQDPRPLCRAGNIHRLPDQLTIFS